MPRPRRVEQEGVQRRRRRDDTLDRVMGLKMTLPDECQNDKDHFYYWSDESKVHERTTNDDYDVVKLEDESSGAARRVVGTDKFGNPQVQVLIRKPMEYHVEDRKKKDARIKASEQGLLSADPENESAAPNRYVVEGSQIKTGAFTP